MTTEITVHDVVIRDDKYRKGKGNDSARLIIHYDNGNDYIILESYIYFKWKNKRIYVTPDCLLYFRKELREDIVYGYDRFNSELLDNIIDEITKELIQTVKNYKVKEVTTDQLTRLFDLARYQDNYNIPNYPKQDMHSSLSCERYNISRFLDPVIACWDLPFIVVNPSNNNKMLSRSELRKWIINNPRLQPPM